MILTHDYFSLDHVEVTDMRVSVCRDAAKGRCSRGLCKYYHLPVVLPPAPLHPQSSATYCSNSTVAAPTCSSATINYSNSNSNNGNTNNNVNDNFTISSNLQNLVNSINMNTQHSSNSSMGCGR